MKPPQIVPELWPSYLINGYFDGTNTLRLEFVRRGTVDALAAALAQAGLTKTQLQRFYQYCRTLEVRLRTGERPWESVAADFLLLESIAEAAHRRNSAPIPILFYDFLVRNCNAVNTRADFLNGFVPHYTALVGFSAAHLRA
jgi:CRISPR/Cas system CSM-associated protein Csm2 small subunit